MTTMRTFARLGVAASAVALSFALAACGSDATPSASSTGSPSSTASASVDATHNATDVSFAQNMIIHHQGAIRMAQMAETHASTQQVKDLAKRIEASQSPEIEEMTSWLEAWGEPVLASGSMGNMDHSSGPMGSGPMGMMTEEQMHQLDAVMGTNFDRMFLEMMTAHHQSAIEMAKTEQANGSNSQAIALARSIETSQTAEIAEMAEMLKNL
jgi:uncharacterized protein (DUF305 family)